MMHGPTLSGCARHGKAGALVHAAALPVAVIAVLGGCSGGTPEPSQPPTTPPTDAVELTAEQVATGGIRWAPVEVVDAAGVVEAPGQIVPNEDRTARLGAPAQGRVVAVHVSLGERVARGEPLVTLQSREAGAILADFRKALAEVESRRTAASFARIAKERADRLLAIQAISVQDAERARTEDEFARAALAQAEAEAERARLAMEELGVDPASGRMVIRSPISGIVLSRDVAPGVVAEAGAPLVAVTDPSRLWLDVSVPDRVASSLALGSPVRFVVPAFPADTFEAKIEAIGGALDAATRLLPVRAVVDNADGRLRPAMFATVWVESGDRRETVVVSEDAVQFLDGRPVVFVARADGVGGARFERREVEIGATVGGRTQIVRGIAPGDSVVVAGAFAVKSEFSRAKLVEE
jgi:cobalt-zinc-cadmium efflux system membrane fusion protein